MGLPPFRQEEAQDIGEGRNLAGADDAVDVPDGGHVGGVEARCDMVGVGVECDGYRLLDVVYYEKNAPDIVLSKNRGVEVGEPIQAA